MTFQHLTLDKYHIAKIGHVFDLMKWQDKAEFLVITEKKHYLQRCAIFFPFVPHSPTLSYTLASYHAITLSLHNSSPTLFDRSWIAS